MKCQDEDNSLERLDKVIGGEFVPIPPLSFYGKTHTKENANHPFAMAIDKLWESQIECVIIWLKQGCTKVVQNSCIMGIAILQLKEYVKNKGISYEAVRKPVKRYQSELEEHISKVNRTQYLDYEVAAFFDEKREATPVILLRGQVKKYNGCPTRIKLS